MASYTVVFEPEEGGGYSVYVPDLPGCASMGDTHDEALANIREAIDVYLVGLQKMGKPVPKPRTIVEKVRVRAA